MLKLLKRSIELDISFLLLNLSLLDKFLFILKKYCLIAYNLVFSKKSWTIRIFWKQYFFDDKYGISFLQSVYIDNYRLKKYVWWSKNIIIDIWANIWQFRFFCEQYLWIKHVYSFEAVPNVFQTLNKNFDKNIFWYAVWTKSQIDIFLSDWSSLWNSISASYGDTKISVACKKLDEIDEIKTIKYIDLLKIDTEWWEYDVITSWLETIKKSKYILIETSINRKNVWDIFEILQKMKEVIDCTIVEIGRPYVINDSLDAVDILFRNNSLFEK